MKANKEVMYERDIQLIKELCSMLNYDYKKVTKPVLRKRQYIYFKYAIIEVLRFKADRKVQYLAELFGYNSHDVIVKAHAKHEERYNRYNDYTDLYNSINSICKQFRPEFYGESPGGN